MEHRNDPVTIYCLSLIAEEISEAGAAAAKSLRFGHDSPDGFEGDCSSKDALEHELGDVYAAMSFAAARGIIDMSTVFERARFKLAILGNPHARDNCGRPLVPPAEADGPAA